MELVRSNECSLRKQRKRVPYHEAGHALVAWLEQAPITGAAIHAAGGFVGPAGTASIVTGARYVRILLAGMVAEGVMFGKFLAPASDNPSDDLTRALAVANEEDMLGSNLIRQRRQSPVPPVDFDWMADMLQAAGYSVPSDRVVRFLTDQLVTTHEMIEANRPALGTLAVELMRWRALTGDEINDLLHGVCPSPPYDSK